MFIFVCDWLINIEGQIDARPIAVFWDMKSARKFLKILAANGIFACMKGLEREVA